jgi:hypothetical protein
MKCGAAGNASFMLGATVRSRAGGMKEEKLNNFKTE